MDVAIARWRFQRAVRQATKPSMATRAVLFAERHVPDWRWLTVLRFRRQLRHLDGTVALWGLLGGMEDEYAEDEEGER